jgi:hypothetical protein
MQKIVDYKLMMNSSFRILESNVKNMIPEGWQPIGGISHTYVAGDKEEYIQALVKYENNK